jgi:hypothetical protein
MGVAEDDAWAPVWTAVAVRERQRERERERERERVGGTGGLMTAARR